MFKKLLLLSAFVFALVQMNAQMTLERSDFTLQAGDMVMQKNLDPASVFNPSEGADQLWDYTSLVTTDTKTDDINANGDLVNFPDSDLSHNYPSFEQVAVFDRTDYIVLNDTNYGRNGVKFGAIDIPLGGSTGNPDDVISFVEGYGHTNINIEYDAWFPMNYGETRSGNFMGSNDALVSVAAFGLDEAPWHQKWDQGSTSETVGWGTLSVVNPADLSTVNLDVLLVKRIDTQVDSFFLYGLPAPDAFLAAFGLVQGNEYTTTTYMFFAKSYEYPILEINDGTYGTILADLGFLVYLKDSNGDPLSGGSLEYQDGGWQTATEVSTGVFRVNTTKDNVNLRMNYADASLYETVPTSTPYTFQTELVTFELRKRTGDLGYNHAQIFYQGFGGLLATTGDAGLGLAQMELLPREYTFRMKFRGGAGDITQDVSVDPVITWQMARMLVQVNKSDGTRGINGVDIKYKGSSLEHFGVTGTSENGRARKDLLPGTYKFTLKHKGGKYVEEDFIVSSGDNELIIEAISMTVSLYYDYIDFLPVDGGMVTNIGVSSNDFGVTGDSGPGNVMHDLLPGMYAFKMEYDGSSSQSPPVDITVMNSIGFFVIFLSKSTMVDAPDVHAAVYPNPFAGNTTFAFELDKDQHVSVDVYDMTGKMVDQLFDGNMTEGSHKMQWDANDVNSGLYIIRLNTETSSYTQRVVKN